MSNVEELYKAVITNGITAHPRSLQKRIGPSEIGKPCDRWVLEAGEPLSAILAAVGRGPHAVTKLAERHGQHDIASIFGNAIKRKEIA